MANISSINGNPIVPSDGSVGTAQIADGSIGDDKLEQSGGILSLVDSLVERVAAIQVQQGGGAPVDLIGYLKSEDAKATYAPKSHKHAMADVTGLQAALDAIAESVYPVGSLYLNATDATNPHDLLGFGTWAAFGQGRMLLSASDAHEAGATGGSETVALTAEQMPGHTHTATTSSAGAHTHTSWYVGMFSNNDTNYGNSHLDKKWNSVGNGGTTERYGRASLTAPSAGEHHHTLTTASAGGGKAHNNMPPYITVYMWVRTA